MKPHRNTRPVQFVVTGGSDPYTPQPLGTASSAFFGFNADGRVSDPEGTAYHRR